MDIKEILPEDHREILRWLKEVVDDFNTSTNQQFLNAERNERFLVGDQYITIDRNLNTIVEYSPDDMPLLTLNYMRNLLNTYVARITQNRPNVKAFAANRSEAALASAKLTNKIISYYTAELKFDKLINESVRNACLHGSAGLKVCFDPLINDIIIDPVTIYDVVFDTLKPPDAGDYIIFKKMLTKSEVMSIAKSAGLTKIPVAESYKDSSGRLIKGYLCHEIWHLPTVEFPKGLYCKVLGDTVLDSIDYQYQLDPFGTRQTNDDFLLPIAWFCIDEVRHNALGDTWFNAAVPIQRQINEVEATLLKMRRETCNVKLVVPDQTTAQQIKPNNQVIISPDGAKNIGYIQPPIIPPLLFTDRQQLYKNLFDISGISEVSAGIYNKTSESGRSIAMRDQLDKEKTKATIENLGTAISRTWELLVKLIQKYFVDSRELSVITGASEPEEFSFYGADINGITLQFEPDSSTSKLKQTAIIETEEDVAKGLADPSVVQDMKAYDGNPSDDLAVEMPVAVDLIKQVLTGQMPQALPSLDPSRMTVALTKVKNIYMQNGGIEDFILQSIDQLINQYSAMLQPIQTEVPNG